MAQSSWTQRTQGLAIVVAIAKSARPRQWLKNLTIFANLVFSGQLLDPDKLATVSIAFVLFCILASSMYFVNDVVDAPRDLLHPFKSKRPIAAGILGKKTALILAFVGTVFALIVSFLLNPFFGGAALVFVILQISYSIWLKHLILLDVMIIAAAFLLRVYSGALVINGHVTVWFILAVTSVALFLAIGKRRSERTLMEAELAAKHRDTLLHYPESLLDALTIMFATGSWLSYAMFTFLEPTPSYSPTVLLLLGDFLPQTLFASKLLMMTVPFVIYAIMRYLYIIYEKREGESPERVLLSDLPLLISVLLWGITLILVIYGPELNIVKN